MTDILDEARKQVALAIPNADKLWEWIRDPDWADVFGVKQIADWINDRPCSAVSQIQHTLSGVPALIERVAALEAENKRLREGLGRVHDWREHHGSTIAVDLGSNGVRDYYRGIAGKALDGVRAPSWAEVDRAILAKGGSDAE